MRRFGRYENFEQFDNSSSGHASVGSKSIGKINIDAQFMFRKSQWGVLGKERYPAGILYLNLNFGPPQDCRVKSATVTITLDEQDPSLTPYQSGRSLHHTHCPVQITDWYGPKQMHGQEKNADVKRVQKLTPEINALGNGAGGVGMESETSFKKSARWSFNGQLLPGKGTWTYKSLRWDLRENELESQTFRNNRVYTAFAFEHAGQPFLMKLEIEGKLEKWNHRVKSKLKFGSSREGEGRTVTLIDFGEWGKYQQQLQRVAEGLPRAMEMKNFEEIPIEVPDSIPGASFQPVSVEDADDAAEALRSGTAAAQQIPSSDPPAMLVEPSRESSRPSINFRERRYLGAAERTEPTVENFRRALHALSRPVLEEDGLPDNVAETFSSNAETLAEMEEEEAAEATSTSDDDRNRKLATASPGLDEATMIKILKIPAMLTILQLLASLMELLGSSSNAEKVVGLQASTGNKPSSVNFGQDQEPEPKPRKQRRRGIQIPDTRC